MFRYRALFEGGRNLHAESHWEVRWNEFSAVSAANQIWIRVIRVENLTRANGSSAHVDGPAPRPVFIASHGLAAPLPLPQNHLEEVNETSLLVSIEDTTTSVSRERNGPNVNLAFRISIVVFFCCLLPLLVAFCIYRYSRSRSSLIKPVSFALKTRAVMRSI